MEEIHDTIFISNAEGNLDDDIGVSLAISLSEGTLQCIICQNVLVNESFFKCNTCKCFYCPDCFNIHDRIASVMNNYQLNCQEAVRLWEGNNLPISISASCQVKRSLSEGSTRIIELIKCRHPDLSDARASKIEELLLIFCEDVHAGRLSKRQSYILQSDLLNSMNVDEVYIKYNQLMFGTGDVFSLILPFPVTKLHIFSVHVLTGPIMYIFLLFYLFKVLHTSEKKLIVPIQTLLWYI